MLVTENSYISVPQRFPSKSHAAPKAKRGNEKP